MTVLIEIHYDAKCKHCAFINLKYIGKRKYSWCDKKDEPMPKNTKACPDFTLTKQEHG